jgi:hypothetical protein
MSKQLGSIQLGSIRLGSIALVVASLVAGGLQASAARAAEECLSAPNARAPQGSHWYFRTDRASHQKCWYVRSQGQTAQQLTPQDKPVAAPVSGVATTLASPDAQGAARDPQPASVATTGDSTQKAAQGVSSQQRSPQPAAPFAATASWPNPAPLATGVAREEPVATPEAAPADATQQQQLADAQITQVTPDDGQNAETSLAADDRSGSVLVALTASPLGIFLVVAMALTMAGILSRAVMKIAAVRRHRVYVYDGDQDWLESIPPEQTPSIAARPVDIGARAERVDRSENELESALRRFMRERDHRAA